MKIIKNVLITVMVMLCLGGLIFTMRLAGTQKNTDNMPALSDNESRDIIDKVIKETNNYLINLDDNPGYGSEWFVIGLARSRLNGNSDYFKTYYKNIADYIQKKDGVLHQSKYTEYSKVIIALTSIGKDARNVAGYNLFSKLADLKKVTSQGINGAIWALIALKSNPEYYIPDDADVEIQTTEQLLIDTILENEIPKGGWALAGTKPDTDITAMALQALSHYYGQAGYEKVTAAADRGIRLLSNLQNADTGGFINSGIENSESCAQVITALTALGIDPKEDSRFDKNGNCPVENLISYYIENNGFLHTKNDSEQKKVNGMSTEQAFYALVSYQRFLNRQKPLYDLSDLTLTTGGKIDISEKDTALEQDDNSNGTEVICTFSISCETILSNMDKLKPVKERFVPADGWIVKPTQIKIKKGETVFDVLLSVCKEKKIHMEHSYTPMYKSEYIEGINQLYEFDCGELSGWTFLVDGKSPNYGCDKYVLSGGETIEWMYTCDLGEDLK